MEQHNVKATTNAPNTEASAEAPQPDELAELKQQYLRLAAEFDNYRKRVQRDRAEQRLRDRDELMLDWLEVVDNVERAIGANPERVEDWREGTTAIHRQMRAILEKYQVRPISPTGARFDPNEHEAVGTVSVPGVEGGQVVHTDRSGYVREGRVLRPARVIVAADPE